MSLDSSAFVHENTQVGYPPLCPEIQLRLAMEMMPLWQVTEQKLEETGRPPPLWAFCWAGGQVLARYILDNPDIVKDKRVLDFACGGGVSAIAAAKAGAISVVANDIDPFALVAAKENAKLNHIKIDTVEGDVIGGKNLGWDVVLAGDICYDGPLAEQAMLWLRQLVQGGALVLLGDPGRPYLPTAGLKEMVRYSTLTSFESEDAKIKEAVVWQVLA